MPDRPNIVLILSDDHGWSDFGFMGSDIARTPQIDALAADGFRFSLAFNTGNICRPSLRSILTGYHPPQYDARVDALRRRTDTNASEPTIRYIETLPRLLAERGYASFQGGKYWEGSFRDGGFSHGLAQPSPTSRDETAARPGDEPKPAALGRFARDPLYRSAGGAGLELGRSTMAPVFRFIDEHQHQPFFVWFAPLLPHKPFDASESDRAPYLEAGLSEAAIGYYANIARLDRRVGELVTHLEERGLRENTLIVVLSDNGWQIERPGSSQDRLMGGVRGKSSIYDRAFRTPLILNWPGQIEPASDDEHVVSTVDLFATLLDVAGVQRLHDRWGESFVPLVAGAGGFERTRVMAEVSRFRRPKGMRFRTLEDQHALFLRTRDWRFVHFDEDDERALYSMRDDPHETQDLCSVEQALCDEMHTELHAWRAMMHASPPIGPSGTP